MVVFDQIKIRLIRSIRCHFKIRKIRSIRGREIES